jgi:hypothetical protein
MAEEKDHSQPSLIPPHGGYRELKSYQNAEIVYDATARFCDRFIDRRSRTHDQMVQAARSGKQNIAEGSMASGTSKKNRTQTGECGAGESRRTFTGLPGFFAATQTTALGERPRDSASGEEAGLHRK